MHRACHGSAWHADYSPTTKLSRGECFLISFAIKTEIIDDRIGQRKWVSDGNTTVMHAVFGQFWVDVTTAAGSTNTHLSYGLYGWCVILMTDYYILQNMSQHRSLLSDFNDKNIYNLLISKSSHVCSFGRSFACVSVCFGWIFKNIKSRIRHKNNRDDGAMAVRRRGD